MRALLLLLPLILSDASDPLALFRQWRHSPSPELRMQAARSLRGTAGRETRAALLTLLSDPHPGVRAAARGELVRRPPGEGPELAREIAALHSPRARQEGLRAVLARREDPTLFATDADPGVRCRALFSGRVALPQARAALRARDALTRAHALEAVGEPEAARARLRDPCEAVRIAVARMCGDAASLTQLARDRSWRVRLAVVRACEQVRDPQLVSVLIGMLRAPPGRVRARTAAALENLTGAGFGEDERRWREWWRQVHAGFRPREQRASRPHAEHTRAALVFRRIPVESRRLCFVIDASRSMDKPAPGGGGKSRWELAVRDLLAVLDRLPADARFNVVLFRTQVEAWRKRLVPATRSARAACRRWIEQARPAGWTNLFDALALALADDQLDTLYVLTDGVPSRGAYTTRPSILDEIAYLDRYKLVAINCVQAGGSDGLSKRWQGFLEELAKAHDGVAVRE